MNQKSQKLHTTADQVIRVFDAHVGELAIAGFRDKSRILVGLPHSLGDYGQSAQYIRALASAVTTPRHAPHKHLQVWLFEGPVEGRPKRLTWSHKKAGMAKEWPTYALLMNSGRPPRRHAIPARWRGSLECRGQAFAPELPVACRIEVCRLTELMSAFVILDWCTCVEAGAARRVRIFSAAGLLYEFSNYEPSRLRREAHQLGHR
jgi:hypothetical protein